MEENEQSVFISYAWGGEREEVVNQIDRALQQRGIKIIRDKRDLGYKGSIKAFMEHIGQGNCVIVVISDKYLRSPNCMFELVEIAENKQFHDRIFPIVLAGANIYDPVKRIEYVKHWEVKRAELAEAMKSLDPANLQGIREDMDLYDRIRDKVSGLTSILKDMNTLTPDMHRESDFREIYDGIEKRMKESPTTPATAASTKDESKPAESAKPTSTVSASNNSIGIGDIRIGGNVDGNIVIGNNKVNNE
jgi:internalin A